MLRRTFMAAAAAASLMAGAASAQETPTMNAFDMIAAEEGFMNFVKALQATGYDEKLRTEGPFTVFVPNDEAFDDPDVEAAFNELMLPANLDKLTSLVGYHIIPGAYTLEELRNKEVQFETMNGEMLRVEGVDEARVGDAAVLAADGIATNGVIYVIDAVQMPMSMPMMKKN